MARKPTTRETVLLSGLAIVLVYVIYSVTGGGGFGFGGSRPAPTKEDPVGVAPVINIAGLHPEPEPYAGGRDLFKYGPPPRTAPPPPPPRVAPPPRVVTPPPPRPRTKAPPKPKAPEPPRIQFKYVGYLGPKDGKIAVFEAGDEIMLARVGDVVQNEFLVKAFKYDSIVMGYTDDKFRDRTAELVQEK